MENAQQIDQAEHDFWSAYCPACGSSPCEDPTSCERFLAEDDLDDPELDADDDEPRCPECGGLPRPGPCGGHASCIRYEGDV